MSNRADSGGTLLRLGNVMQWRDADKTAVAAVIILVFHGAYVALASFQLSHPEVAPYIDPVFVQWATWVTTRVAIPAWIIVLAITRALRHRNLQWLVHVSTLLYFIEMGAFSYFFGSHTSMFTSLTVIAGLAYTSILYGARVPVLGVLSFVAIISVTSLLEQLGVMPYAPIWLDPPIVERHLATSWLLAFGTLDAVTLLGVLGVIFFLAAQLQNHQARLAETSDQLGRANELISRYVAQQVAEQIQLGNYDAIDRQYRRRLTLFFSDIKGFTEVADHVEAEELSELLNEYFAEMTTITHRFGGTIDKFMGDAIMILFGAPLATDDQDHALRAVRMALAMQVQMSELSRRWEERGLIQSFQIRIGINTGVASVGNFGAPGRMDYTAIGRQVNLAARLQVNCEPGKVLISHATWVLVRDQIPCQAKGEIQVKGIRDPVKVYEVTPSAED